MASVVSFFKRQFFRAQSGFTAIFIMVVSSTVLADDVSALASDVSMGIAVFPNG